MANLQQTDSQIADLIAKEQRRQESTLELIASENHVSAAVLEAAGTVLTNKYAEGYPGARYYGGGEVHDRVANPAHYPGRKRGARLPPHTPGPTRGYPPPAPGLAV